MTVDYGALEALRARVVEDIETGLEFGGVEGCTAALAYRGELIWAEGFGAASAHTPITLMSLTKTVVEAALWVLFDGQLEPTTPIVDVVPEFMDGSQPDITVGMVETHLGGFAWHPLPDAELPDRDARLDAIRSWRLDRPAGYYEYHPLTGAWVLAEVIERVSGQDYRAFLSDQVLVPLGLARPDGLRLGVPADEVSTVLRHRNYAGGYTPDNSRRPRTGGGIETASGLQLGVPGIGATGTAGAVALLYQSYLHNESGLWRPDVLARARDEVVVDMPDVDGRPMLRSLSFVHAGAVADRYGERMFFGPAVSPRAFGHQGLGGQIAWADPESGISFAYLTNTVVFPPGGTFHGRSRELSWLATEVVI